MSPSHKYHVEKGKKERERHKRTTIFLLLNWNNCFCFIEKILNCGHWNFFFAERCFIIKKYSWDLLTSEFWTTAFFSFLMTGSRRFDGVFNQTCKPSLHLEREMTRVGLGVGREEWGLRCLCCSPRSQSSEPWSAGSEEESHGPKAPPGWAGKKAWATNNRGKTWESSLSPA